jgi:hypothetical protein
VVLRRAHPPPVRGNRAHFSMISARAGEPRRVRLVRAFTRSRARGVQDPEREYMDKNVSLIRPRACSIPRRLLLGLAALLALPRRARGGEGTHHARPVRGVHGLPASLNCRWWALGWVGLFQRGVASFRGCSRSSINRSRSRAWRARGARRAPRPRVPP